MVSYRNKYALQKLAPKNGSFLGEDIRGINIEATGYPKTVLQSALADIVNQFLTEKADRLSVFGQPHRSEDSF